MNGFAPGERVGRAIHLPGKRKMMTRPICRTKPSARAAPAGAKSDNIDEGLKGVSFPHGFTYSGHPACCAAAVRNMEILVKENLPENAAKVGNHILGRLKTEFMRLPYVGDVNGLGLMIGVELVKDKANKATAPPERRLGEDVIARAQEKGLLIREWGGRLVIAPPLIITVQEADLALDVLKHVLIEI